jgi:opacity protein-like surface antigen
MSPSTRALLSGALIAGFTIAGNPAGAAEDEWSFSVAPLYLWAKNIKGEATAGGNTLPLDLDFEDDILDNLDAAFAIHAEANKGEWTLFVEFNYAKLDPTATTRVGPVEITGDVDFKDYMYEGGAAWRIAKTETSTWELYAGLRYLKQDITVAFSNNLHGQILPPRVKAGDSWIHPFGGVRYSTSLGDRWGFRARADFGYEDSDNSAVQAMARVDFRFTDLLSGFLGYRYLDIDFQGTGNGPDEYAFDGEQQGPVLGVEFNF